MADLFTRDLAIAPAHSALVFIDVQNYATQSLANLVFWAVQRGEKRETNPPYDCPAVSNLRPTWVDESNWNGAGQALSRQFSYEGWVRE